MTRPHANGGQAPSQGEKKAPEDRHRHTRILNRERVHFSFGSNDLQSMIGRLRPIIREYAKSGVRKPKDVARELNTAGVRTACGGKWSPRLTWLLLTMVFEKGAPGAGLWQRAKLSAAPRAINRPATQTSSVRTRATPSVVSLEALPLPEPPRVVRKVEYEPIQLPKKIKRRRIAPDSALRMIAKLPDMALQEIAKLFSNSVSNLADRAKAHLHDATRKLLDAINEEWQRREQVGNPDDYFQWPSTEAEGGNGALSGQNWPSEGLLKFMGYTVGATQGERVQVRELILERVFSGHLPRIVSPDYMKEWGRPATAPRLRKMAETIAALARNAKRRNNASFDQAIRDWEHDLSFLYRTYYVGHFGFGWPSTSY